MYVEHEPYHRKYIILDNTIECGQFSILIVLFQVVKLNYLTKNVFECRGLKLAICHIVRYGFFGHHQFPLAVRANKLIQ